MGSLGLAWVCIAGKGFVVLSSYANTPSLRDAVPVEWPAGSTVNLDHDKPTLVMFAHLMCPCTQASIGEFELIMTRCSGLVSARVLFTQWGASEEVEESTLWKSAAAIPGVEVASDSAGKEARRFRVHTSGETVLYDQRGHLLFAGGITFSRGHSGDNNDRRAIVSLLTGGNSYENMTPSFGCSLIGLDNSSVGEPPCKR